MSFPLLGLVAYWPLDEPGGVRRDVHGDNHLTEHNGVGSAPGRIKRGAHFAQVNAQYLSSTSAPIQTGDGPFTLAAWINPATSGPMIVIGKDASNGRDYILDVSANARARFACTRSNKTAEVESTGPDLVPGMWAYLVAAYDPTAQTIALRVNDGPADTASTVEVPLNITGAEFRIGSRVGAAIGEHFNGVVDEVGLWRLSLTATDCSALWNSGAGLRYPPPVTLCEALRDRLLVCPDVADVVGERIYTLKFPQSVTPPALRLHEIDRVSTMQLRGDERMRRARVQIDAVEAEAHGDAYDRAHALADAVRGDLRSGHASGLVGFQGQVSRLEIAAILGDDRREAYDPEARMVRVEQDFLVWFHV